VYCAPIPVPRRFSRSPRVYGDASDEYEWRVVRSETLFRRFQSARYRQVRWTDRSLAETCESTRSRLIGQGSRHGSLNTPPRIATPWCCIAECLRAVISAGRQTIPGYARKEQCRPGNRLGADNRRLRNGVTKQQAARYSIMSRATTG